MRDRFRGPSPPSAAADEGRKGARYWYFTGNELGMEDVAAQIDHLHIVKCAELRTAGAGFVAGPLAHGFRRQAAARGAMRRSASGCACPTPGQQASVPVRSDVLLGRCPCAHIADSKQVAVIRCPLN